MKTEQKIVRTLLETEGGSTIRQLSKAIGADYRITHTAATRLMRRGVVTARPVGRSSLCSLASRYSTDIYLAEAERRDMAMKDSTLAQLLGELMARIKGSLFICLLFGSYAKGTQRKGSDIDLLFISNEKGFEEQVQDILSTLPLDTHPFVLTEQEFTRMFNARQHNVVKEAERQSIILYGIESYHRLKNA